MLTKTEMILNYESFWLNVRKVVTEADGVELEDDILHLPFIVLTTVTLLNADMPFDSRRYIRYHFHSTP